MTLNLHLHPQGPTAAPRPTTPGRPALRPSESYNCVRRAIEVTSAPASHERSTQLLDVVDAFVMAASPSDQVGRVCQQILRQPYTDAQAPQRIARACLRPNHPEKVTFNAWHEAVVKICAAVGSDHFPNDARLVFNALQHARASVAAAQSDFAPEAQQQAHEVLEEKLQNYPALLQVSAKLFAQVPATEKAYWLQTASNLELLWLKEYIDQAFAEASAQAHACLQQGGYRLPRQPKESTSSAVRLLSGVVERLHPVHLIGIPFSVYPNMNCQTATLVAKLLQRQIVEQVVDFLPENKVALLDTWLREPGFAQHYTDLHLQLRKAVDSVMDSIGEQFIEEVTLRSPSGASTPVARVHSSEDLRAQLAVAAMHKRALSPAHEDPWMDELAEQMPLD